MGIFDKLFKRGKSQTMFTSFGNSDLGIMYDGDGYIPLARNPDVIIAVNKIADMVSNMTIQLMENTESGDVRIKDGLARKIDINPCDHMTRKSWIFKIVRDLLLFGDGNSVLHVEYDPMTDYISNLRPFPMSEVSFKSNDLTYMIHFRDTDFNPDEVVHFAINPDPDRPYIGTGFRLALKDIVRNLNMATQTKKGFMNGKNVPSLIVKVDSSSEELGTVEGREKIAKKYLTTSQSGEPWIVPDALMEVEQVKPLSLNDIALNESVEIDKKTVAGMLGVPAFVLGVGDFNKEEYNNFVGFMNGKNVPSLIVKVDSSSEELGTVEGREKIAKKYLTTSQSGEPWIVPDALMEVEQVKPLSLNDIALNESVEIDKKTVAGMLGVPAFVLGVGDFNKEEYNNFVNTTIMSIATTITQTLTRDLLTSSTRYFKFNPRSLYSYDITELSTVAQQMTNSAAMRRNEWRDWVGMTPDPEMDEIIVLENYLPQGELGNQSKLNKEGGNASEET